MWDKKKQKHFEWFLWHWSSLGQLNLEPTRPNGLVGCKGPTDLVKISVKEATHMGFCYRMSWDLLCGKQNQCHDAMRRWDCQMYFLFIIKVVLGLLLVRMYHLLRLLLFNELSHVWLINLQTSLYSCSQLNIMSTLKHLAKRVNKLVPSSFPNGTVLPQVLHPANQKSCNTWDPNSIWQPLFTFFEWMDNLDFTNYWGSFGKGKSSDVFVDDTRCFDKVVNIFLTRSTSYDG